MHPATLTVGETLARLGGMTARQFRRSYQKLFTDARPPHLQGTTSPRLFYRIEVELASEPGGWKQLAQRRAEQVRRQKVTR